MSKKNRNKNSITWTVIIVTVTLANAIQNQGIITSSRLLLCSDEFIEKKIRFMIGFMTAQRRKKKLSPPSGDGDLLHD